MLRHRIIAVRYRKLFREKMDLPHNLLSVPDKTITLIIIIIIILDPPSLLVRVLYTYPLSS
jgi:hypothetical protein